MTGNANDRIDAVFPRAVHAGRVVAAVIVGAALAAATWLFTLQEGHTGQIFGRTWTEHNFPDGLGNAFDFEDTARGGLLLTFLGFVVVAVAYLALRRRMPSGVVGQGLVVGIALFVVWGLVFTPLVDARQIIAEAKFTYLPTGVFGIDAGWGTVVSGILASVFTGIVLVRVVSLMCDSDWWQEHAEVVRGTLSPAQSDLLELPEERTEQRVERSG